MQAPGNGVVVDEGLSFHTMNTRASTIKLVRDTPLRMGHWLLTNFDPVNMCFRLENGDVLNIREDDLQAVLGLPRGEIVITKQPKDDVSDLLKEWRGNFIRDKHDVTLGIIGRKFAQSKAKHKRGRAFPSPKPHYYSLDPNVAQTIKPKISPLIYTFPKRMIF
nr:uncharacterized protein LOC109189836 [Ipomoea batatas]